MRLERVGQVRVVEEEPRLRLVRIAVEVVDPPGVERAGAADQPVDLVALLQEKLGEVRAVLAGDPGDQRLRCRRAFRASCGDRVDEGGGAGEAGGRGGVRAPRRRARRRPSSAASAGSARRRARAVEDPLRLAGRDDEPGPGALDLARRTRRRAGRRRRSAGRRRSSEVSLLGRLMSICVARSESRRTSAAASRLAWIPSGWTPRKSTFGRSAAAARIASAWFPPPDEDESDGVAPFGGQPGGVDDLLQALLEAHVPGVEDDLVAVRPAEAARASPAGHARAPPGASSWGRGGSARSGTPREARYGVNDSATTPIARAPARGPASAARVALATAPPPAIPDWRAAGPMRSWKRSPYGRAEPLAR